MRYVDWETLGGGFILGIWVAILIPLFFDDSDPSDWCNGLRGEQWDLCHELYDQSVENYANPPIN